MGKRAIYDGEPTPSIAAFVRLNLRFCMDWVPIANFIKGFMFGYPFVMAWYWMVGGLLYHWLRERHEPRPKSRRSCPNTHRFPSFSRATTKRRKRRKR